MKVPLVASLKEVAVPDGRLASPAVSTKADTSCLRSNGTVMRHATLVQPVGSRYRCVAFPKLTLHDA